MTLREALLLDIKLWHWILDNLPKDKENWPEWESGMYYIYAGKTVRFGCFLCQYQKELQNGCILCPLIIDGQHCGNEGHPCCKYLYANSVCEQQKHIKVIVAKLEKALMEVQHD